MPEVRKLWQTEGLFSDHYLKVRIHKNAWWPTDDQARPLWQFCKDLYEKRYLACAKNNEAFTRQELLDKVLEKLGFAWTDNLSLPDQDAEPDYILFASAAEKEAVIEKSRENRYRAAVAILEAKKVNHPLSQRSKHQQRYPHQQIRDYLSEAQMLTWGILTNGNEWRLYCRDTKPSQFFGINFELAAKSLEEFKFFLALFSPAAFVRDAQGKCRLDFVRESALAAQSDLEEDLRLRIFNLVELLANGFAERAENQIDDTDEDRGRLYNNCLIFLYLKGGDFTRYAPVESGGHWLRHNWQRLLEPEVDIFGFSSDFLRVPEKLVYRQTADELIGSIDTEGLVVDKTVHMILLRKEYAEYSHKYLLSLFNSNLSNFAYQDFAQEEGRAFAQVKTFNIKRLPIRRIDFTTPPADRKKLVAKARELYERCLARSNPADALEFVEKHLRENRTDVIHDLLAFLAERMMALNKGKQTAVKQFLTDLKDFHGVDARSLTPKTKLDEFWKLQAADVFAHFRANKLRLKEGDEEKIRGRFQSATDKLLPLETQLAFTDALIDQIVYRLYALTADEIKVVEEGARRD